MEDEIWLPLSGFEKTHHGSNQGRIKRLSTVRKCRSNSFRTLQEKILSLGKTITGYHITSISKDRKCLYVHRLIAKTFIPNPENKKTVNHKNGIKTDNRVVNLEWNTQSENNSHSYKTRLKMPVGAKLNYEVAAEIREIYKLKTVSFSELGRRYKISPTTISDIIHNKSWV